MPPDHIPVETLVTEPFKVIVGIGELQTVISGPAFAVPAVAICVTVTVVVAAGQPVASVIERV